MQDTLFTDDFPKINSGEELEKVKNKYFKYDPYYVTSGCISDRREKFDKLWSIYKEYADKHFLKQIKNDFHSRTWEMYLGNILIKNNIKFESLDKGPDIKINNFDKPIFIEATACKKGNGENSVPELNYGHASSVPEDEMLLRLTSSLSTKFKKYEDDLSKSIINKDDPFMIAINRGALEHVDPEMPLILKCLFCIGHYRISIPAGGNMNEAKGSYSRREKIIKKSGVEVPMNFFENKDHSGISAIIYSRRDVLNAPDLVGSDCILVHNPNAKNPIDKNYFKFLKQYIVTGNQIKII